MTPGDLPRSLQCFNPDETNPLLEQFRSAISGMVDEVRKEDCRERELQTYLSLGASTVAEFMYDEPAHLAAAFSDNLFVVNLTNLDIVRQLHDSPDHMLWDRLELCRRYQRLPRLLVRERDPLIVMFLNELMKNKVGLRLYCKIVLLLGCAQEDPHLAQLIWHPC